VEIYSTVKNPKTSYIGIAIPVSNAVFVFPPPQDLIGQWGAFKVKAYEIIVRNIHILLNMLSIMVLWLI